MISNALNEIAHFNGLDTFNKSVHSTAFAGKFDNLSQNFDISFDIFILENMFFASQKVSKYDQVSSTITDCRPTSDAARKRHRTLTAS